MKKIIIIMMAALFAFRVSAQTEIINMVMSAKSDLKKASEQCPLNEDIAGYERIVVNATISHQAISYDMAILYNDSLSQLRIIYEKDQIFVAVSEHMRFMLLAPKYYAYLKDDPQGAIVLHDIVLELHSFPAPHYSLMAPDEIKKFDGAVSEAILAVRLALDESLRKTGK